MQDRLKSDNHPFVSLVYLVLLAFAGALIFTVLGLALSVLLYGIPDDLGSFMTGDAMYSLKYLKIIQIFSSAGMFLVPPFIIARIESNHVFSYLSLNKRAPVQLYVYATSIMVAAMPVLDLSVELNQAMKLPGSLAGVEEWMRTKEKEMEVLTKQFLVMNSVGELALNLFMIAILPAISEELLFRGCLQKVFSRWCRNHHAGIWIAAIIFSAIHVQFYGFFPRMLLGALFGYLLVWSNSIWIPILAHFINNGVTVIAAYSYQKKGMSLDSFAESSGSSLWEYLASFFVTAILLYAFYRYRVGRKQDERGLA